MTDNPETARARELLKSSEEALEISRNRPRVEVSDWSHREEPVVRKTKENAMIAREAPKPAVAKVEFDALRDAVIDRLGFALAEIQKLQQRIADLEKATGTTKIIEWPIRSSSAA